MNEVISQTIFSSYNDSDSNATLRFNRNGKETKMTVTTNDKADKFSNGPINVQDERKKKRVKKPEI